MTRTEKGFIFAALFNFGIVGVSRGFSDVLGAVDPLFGPGGCIGIVLWGLAYFALRNRYAQAPALSLVFCLEKLFYVVHWAVWMSANSGELPAMFEQDPLTASFFASYGVGDAMFMLFFGAVAYKERARLSGRIETKRD